jgi:hypothetical protein
MGMRVGTWQVGMRAGMRRWGCGRGRSGGDAGGDVAVGIWAVTWQWGRRQ